MSRNNPHFRGIVTEVSATSILAAVNEDEEARDTSDLISVSRRCGAKRRHVWQRRQR
ncbi:MAG: hypothetical protein LBS84_01940 [Clostridiales bacterium]|nr:hypothetical protein [Clostridiales bacterium]